ncbi:MAG: Dyp-type peroxidase [Deltaproteobacteria bacterium]|jgi:putative iron-dependent peroxidase|nr:Dyp-type peroxidase [Deltaproteobacteria bacterium]
MRAQDVTLKPGGHAIFMVLGLNRPDEIEPVKAICSELPALVRSLKGRFPKQEASCVMGFGSSAWDHLFPKRKKPSELSTFVEIKGEKHTAPSTPGDLFFHIRASKMDIAYELAAIITYILGDSVYSIDEVHGFRYFDGRAIIGFVDGTENPEFDEDRHAAAVIGDKEPDFEGGSYAFVQKYIHNMNEWNNLPTFEQEKAIGRRKFDDRELSDDIKPENAHNAVTNIEDEAGNEIKIVRANMPFAVPSQGEHGTYFIGYASTFSATRKMLENMFIGEPIGNYDRLLDFSTAKTGTLFFIPSVELLEELAE